jgi:hypothetical protein
MKTKFNTNENGREQILFVENSEKKRKRMEMRDAKQRHMTNKLDISDKLRILQISRLEHNSDEYMCT